MAVTVMFVDPKTCYVCKNKITEGSVRDGTDPTNPRVFLCTDCDDVVEKRILDGKNAFA